VEHGAFRQDLFHRLRGVSLRIPPLRERRADIAVLAAAFLRRVAPHKRFSDAALRALGKHPFWGNVRELHNVVERSALLARIDEIGPSDLVFGDEAKKKDSTLSLALGLNEEQTAEAHRIAAALEKTNDNQSAAADLLGMSRRSLVYKLSEYGLPRPRKPASKK
jgi:DNA-binding NtrC family response regulator